MLDIPSAPVANAIPVLVQPFPVPAVCITYGTRPERNNAAAPLGISFRAVEGTHHSSSNNNNTGLVIIHDISDTTIRQQQSTGQARAGQVVVSIDGIAVNSPQHAESLIRATTGDVTSSTNDESYYTLITREIVAAPFCKFIVRNCGIHTNPGIAFAATRDHTLVKVSRIFKNGPFHNTSLTKGDIVLAVNQYTVSTTEQALRALQISKFSTFFSLYVVDITHFRCSILREVKSTDPKKFGLVRIHASDESAEAATFKVANTPIATLEFNPDTQHILDRQQFKNRFTCKDIIRMYHTITVPYVTMFNELIDSRMDSIEETVANETWRNPVPYPQSSEILLSGMDLQQQQQLHPNQLHQQQQRSRSNSQQSYESYGRNRTYSNNCCDPTTISIVDAFALPIPEEDVEVIPLVAEDQTNQ